MPLALRVARSTLALSLVAACGAERPAAAGAGSLSAADHAAVLAVDSAFSAAAKSGDVDRLAALYAEDAMLLPPNAPPVKGRDAIRAFWKGLLDAYTVDVPLGQELVEGRGDLAYQVGHYRLVTTPKGSGTPAMAPEDGKYLEVLKKGSDGTWRYVADMYSSNGK